MSTLTDKEIADVIKMGGAIKGRPLMPSHPQLAGTEHGLAGRVYSNTQRSEIGY